MEGADEDSMTRSHNAAPSSMAVLGATKLPFGFLFDAFDNSRLQNTGFNFSADVMQLISGAPDRCTRPECGAILDGLTTRVNDELCCSFCHQKVTMSRGLPQNPKQQCRTMFVEPPDIAPEDPSPLSFSHNMDQTLIFVLDEKVCYDCDLDKDNFLSMFKSLSSDWNLCLITFGGSVSVYHLASSKEAVSADCYSGDDSLSDVVKESVKANVHEYISTWNVCHLVFRSVILDAMSGSDMSDDLHDFEEERRCFSTAIELGLEIATAMKSRCGIRGHMMVVTGGHASCGPGTTSLDFAEGSNDTMLAGRYFKDLGIQARLHGICVNLFCIGAAQFQMASLRPLINESGGFCKLFPDIFNMTIWTDMLWIAENYFSGQSTSTIEVKSSAGILLDDIIGNVVVDQSGNYKICSIYPNSCLAIYLTLAPSTLLVHQFASIQCKATWTSRANNKITSVHSFRIPVASSVDEFVSSMSSEVVAILLARKQVILGSNLPSDQLLGEQDMFANAVAACTRVNTVDSLAPLQLLPWLQYNFTRSPLRGFMLQHDDDILVLRDRFLKCNRTSSMRLILPELYLGTAAGLEPVSLSTLAMWPTRVLLLDHDTHVYVWVGSRAATTSHYATAKQFCLDHASMIVQRRRPQPNFMEVSQGSSDARWISCRLNPGHHDSLDEQIEDIPELSQLSPSERTEVSQLLPRTGELSFRQFARSKTTLSTKGKASKQNMESCWQQ